MLVIRIMLVLGLLLLSLPGPLPAQDQASAYSFAESLFAEGDYYRAITEYKRYLHMFPQAQERPRALLRIGQSYLAGERWEQAEQALQRLAREFPASRQAETASLLYAEIPFQQKDFPLARQRFLDLQKHSASPDLKREATYRAAWTLVEQDKYRAAASDLAQLDLPAALQLAAAMEQMEHLPRKSPPLAGGLSALLPGAGQLYTERPKDAALAFGLNAAFILGAVEAWNNDNKVVAAILAFFEAGWYTGNIYNAANHAHKFNRDQREREKQKLRERFGVTLNLREGAAGLKVAFRF